MPVFLLIVIYNKDCCDKLPLYRRLLAEGCTVIIYDNSTAVFHNDAVCRENGIVYLGGKGNMGISKAYNEAAAYCRNQSEEGFLCLFDDDTAIPLDYIAEVKKYNGSEKAVLLPMLYGGETLISPAILKSNYRCDFFPGPEAVKAYRGPSLTALNSGMVVSLKVFADYRYDERLFLDGIDHRFMDDMKKIGVPFYFLNCGLKHELSVLEKPSLKSALHRFHLFKNDIRIYDEKRWRRILYRRALKLSLQYRTCLFFKELLKS